MSERQCVPLRRWTHAYCALKIAVDADARGRYLRALEHLPREDI